MVSLLPFWFYCFWYIMYYTCTVGLPSGTVHLVLIVCISLKQLLNNIGTIKLD